ncbi:hypothetical protein BDN67DRAFT_1072801 [Paxillus ammoniavirescens]|nr:hypothetical protein BDN67DRAFT_1072801 [Paxillus ammoniavirescens]
MARKSAPKVTKTVAHWNLTAQSSKKANPQASLAGQGQGTSLEQFQAIADAQKKAYLLAWNTTGSYDGQVNRAKAFLASLVAAKRKAAASHQESIPGGPEPDVDLDMLSRAFDKTPNRYSAMAVEFFLVEKCLNQNWKASMATSIHAAFCEYWDHASGDKYRGEYHHDEASDTVRGNPARAAVVQDMLDSIKKKDKSEGDPRNHAQAMTIEYMKKFMDWSLEQASVDALDRSFEDPASLVMCAWHFMLRAVAATGFTIWCRIFEALQIKFKDITLDCEGCTPYDIPYDLLKLHNRKGWQKHVGQDGPLRGNDYEIYNQPQIPHIDMCHHLRAWLAFAQKHILRRKF